jgi:hypothetical protein
MPNIDAELIIKLTEEQLPAADDKDEELQAIFELKSLMNVIVLDRLSPAAYMAFYTASRNAFESYRNGGSRDDGTIVGWFERVCEEWERLLKLMEADPRFDADIT